MIVQGLTKTSTMNLLIADRACRFGDEEISISVLMPDLNLIEEACEIIQIVAGIISRDALVVAGDQGNFCITPLGCKVLQVASYDFEGVLDALKGARLHPYIRIVKVVLESSISDAAHETMLRDGRIGYLRFLEKAVLEDIDEKYSIPELKKASRYIERGVRKNLSSISEYLDNMFCKRANVCSIAVELRYIYSHWDDRQHFPSADVVKKDLGVLVRWAEDESSVGLRGYIWRVEFGLSDRFYARAIFFVDRVGVREFCDRVKHKGEQKLKVSNGTRPCTVYVYDFCSESPDVETFSEVDDAGLEIIKRRLSVLFGADTMLKADVSGRGRCFGKAGPFMHGGRGN